MNPTQLKTAAAPQQVSPEQWLVHQVLGTPEGKAADQEIFEATLHVVKKIQGVLIGQNGHQAQHILMRNVWAVVESRANFKAVLETVQEHTV